MDRADREGRGAGADAERVSGGEVAEAGGAVSTAVSLGGVWHGG